MAEPLADPKAPQMRANIPRRERSYACVVCGYGPASGIHLPALTGPRKGKPWGHTYVAPGSVGSSGVPGNQQGLTK
jgi:hypothetical protein